MSYFKQGSLIEMLSTTATAGGTTTLTAASRSIQQFTGTLTQTVVLPDATTLPVGRKFYIANRSTGLVTVNKNGGTLLTLVVSDFQREIRLVDNSTAAGVWDVSTGSTGSGGSGAKNYITNGTFDTDTSGWATYADAAGASPVDGTGGSPNVTITRTTTQPLSGNGSALLTKDAANRQGQGWSYDFTIDRADLAKVLQIGFDYLINSGTFVAGAPGSNSDITVWLYDVTNGVVIQPSNIKLFSNNGMIPDRFQASFQTDGVSENYRLILHVASTSASAYELKADNFKVTPSEYIFGTPVTDSQEYAPTLNSLTGVAARVAEWVRIGDSMRVKGYVAYNAAGAAGGFTVALPTGRVIDTAKLPAGGGGLNAGGGALGHFFWEDNGTNYRVGSIVFNSTTNVAFVADSSTGTLDSSGFANNDEISFEFTVPIVGWSSSVQTSDNADTRIAAARYQSGTSQGFTSTPTIFDYGSKSFDTHGAVTTGSAWKFTAPCHGFYRVSHANLFGNATWTAGSTWNSFLYKNGSLYAQLYTAENETSIQAARQVQGSTVVELNAGDYIDVRLTQTSGGTENTNNDSTQNYIDIERITGPAAIAATETIACRVWGSTTVLTNATTVGLAFLNKAFDTHDAYSIANSEFTCPAAGKYEVTVSVLTNGFIAGSDSSHIAAKVQQALAATPSTFVDKARSVNAAKSTASVNHWSTVTTTIDCAAGDRIRGAAFQDMGATPTLVNAEVDTYMTIKRVK